MHNHNNALITQIFMQVLFGLGILCVSIICELMSLHILPVGIIICLFLVLNGVRLYRVLEKGDYQQLIGTCIGLDNNKMTKKTTVSFRLENGVFLKMTLKGNQSLPIKDEKYIFFVRNKDSLETITHTDVLAWSIYEPEFNTKG